jgi:predicted nucleic acid-binding protein
MSGMKKYLVDTCGWIEWLMDGKLAVSFEPYLKQLSHLVVPTLVQYELYKWICREKNTTTALEIIGITERATVVALDTHLALAAADIARENNLAMADAIIYATAQKNNAELITSDRHFARFTGVMFIEKTCGRLSTPSP